MGRSGSRSGGRDVRSLVYVLARDERGFNPPQLFHNPHREPWHTYRHTVHVHVHTHDTYKYKKTHTLTKHQTSQGSEVSLTILDTFSDFLILSRKAHLWVLQLGCVSLSTCSRAQRTWQEMSGGGTEQVESQDALTKAIQKAPKSFRSWFNKWPLNSRVEL